MPSVKDLVSLYSSVEDSGSTDSNVRECSRSSVASSLLLQGRPRTSAILAPTASSSTSRKPEFRHDSGTFERRHEMAHLLGETMNADHVETIEALGMNELSKPSESESLGLDNDNATTHTPIPATTVFAREAAPLYLPDLDYFLSNLPSPSFSRFTTGVRVGKKIIGQGMFPPMDRLTATKKTLLDLETNSTVAPAWRNRTTILGAISNTSLSITGSSVAATFYSLHGLIDVLQVFALILNSMIAFSDMDDVKDDWRKLLLGTIPNVLAFNLGTTVVQSSAVLILFIFVSMILLYIFWSRTRKIRDESIQEGFPRARTKGSGYGLIIVSFALAILYLPLSTIVTHALVWSSDFWAVPNPYINATSFPPILPPLGPSDEFYDPLDFCYTTTMKRNEGNFAPIIVIISAAAFLTVTIWFPIRLRSVIRHAVPKVDRFTERGTPRSGSELDREYQRLLERDRNPISFLYSDFRRGWGTYKSIYLFAKLSALFIVSIMSPDNCLFRTLSRARVSIARQATLSVAMLCLFLLQCFRVPFIDPINNAGEWTSRLGYFLTSLVGLAAAFDISGSEILNGPILYIIYILTYGFAVYFTCIDFAWMQRIVKRIAGRLDFSIDIFSPRLDLSPHVKRRTWQESVTALLLTSPECQIPEDQPMLYANANGAEYPPYLLGFSGSPAERHIENLKILREIGSKEYLNGYKSLEGEGRARILWHRIQHEYTGPDMAWIGTEGSDTALARFGTAWWIPFPPTLVLHYDSGGRTILNRTDQFEKYVRLNASKVIQKKRQLRLGIRSLDGQIVRWPYEYHEPIGNHHRLLCFGRRYRAKRTMTLQRCVLSICRKGRLGWQGVDLGSGFDVTLVYTTDIKVSGDVLGLSDEWELTPTLARFLSLNKMPVLERLPAVEWTVEDFRRYHRKECQRKAKVLSYQFLMNVYDQPQRHKQLMERVAKQEKDLRVRELVLGAADAFEAGCERFEQAVTSQAAAWWYIFWDDVWRRNCDAIKNLRLYESDFNPHYPTCAAYRPLPRPVLESFLRQRGLYGKRTLNAFFHPGLLNKMYFWLSEIVFRDTNHAVQLHVGERSSELNLSAIDSLIHARSSSLGTGGGTDHDDISIRARPTYRWEGLLEDPIRDHQRESGWLEKLGVWLGLTPLWRSGMVTQGIALDVKLQDDRYVRMSRINDT